MIWQSLCDWHMWPLYILGLVHMIPVGPPQTYLTLSLRNLGFNTTEANLLSIPSVVIGIITILFTSFLSEAVNSRVLATVVLQLWALPLLVALYTFNRSTSQWVYFAVVTLMLVFERQMDGGLNSRVMFTARGFRISTRFKSPGRRVIAVRTRTVSASVYNMFVQAGAVVYANIYRADDKPLYKRGNRTLIAVCSMNIVLYGLVFLFYRTVNRRRDRTWNAWSKE
ncbi:hypothetical protein FS749_007332, partial [Ceratobasidium sp. UAMH 11750]